MDLIGSTFLQLALSSPLFLVWIIGIVLAALRLREPRFRVVLIALVLFLILGIGGVIINSVLPVTLMRRSFTAAQVGGVLGFVGLIRIILEAGTWGLLLIALFRVARPSPLSKENSQPFNP